MIDIRPLAAYDRERFLEIATGYTATERFRVSRQQTVCAGTFDLDLEPLGKPFTKTWEWCEEQHAFNKRVVAEYGCSFGAYDADALVGVAIAEPRAWFDDLCVWELHVHAGYRGRGIGRRLIDAMVECARKRRLRTVTCETQNTNVPAIRFYRAVGFELAGLDLWYYPPEIGEVALFMKRRVCG